VAQLQRSARLVGEITAVDNPVRDFRELTAILKRLTRVGDVLEKGVKAQHFSATQIRSLASGLEGVGTQLRKAADRGKRPRGRTAKTKR